MLAINYKSHGKSLAYFSYFATLVLCFTKRQGQKKEPWDNVLFPKYAVAYETYADSHMQLIRFSSVLCFPEDFYSAVPERNNGSLSLQILFLDLDESAYLQNISNSASCVAYKRQRSTEPLPSRSVSLHTNRSDR